jgi:hypothetical protein
VACREIGELGVVIADFQGVCARRVQQPIAHGCADAIGRDHRLGDEAANGSEDENLVDGRACHDCPRRLERKVADKYSESAKHHAFHRGQEPITPIQRRLQGPLTWRRRALPLPWQSQALLEKCRGFLQAIGLNSSGCQLNREWHTVELSADARHDRGVLVIEVQTQAARFRALQE